MAPPEIVDYTEGSVLHYNGFGSNGVNFHRLAIEDYVAELVRCKFKGSIQDIKESHRIKAAKVGTEKLTEAWKVYDCFIFETELKEPGGRKRTFVLFAGDWYEIEKGFKKSIEAFFASLEQRVLVTARKLDALDESKVIGEPRTIDESPKHLTQNEFAVLDELGVGRPELELPEVTRDSVGPGDAESRQTA